ncbi:hypothetical protein [Burkholderia ubonensis]|uniref:hypothetical protein n=1 Tax=Burkholderia ubonensis TaxID=101571 RepID=UPI000AD568CB|nr:hypothetical protein [Burkholderia ubonensis]
MRLRRADTILQGGGNPAGVLTGALANGPAALSQAGGALAGAAGSTAAAGGG